MLGAAHFEIIWNIHTCNQSVFCQCLSHAQIIFSTSQNGMQSNLVIIIQKSYSQYLSLK